MVPGQVSQSMVSVAMRRAAHQLLDRPLIFEDPIAVGLVPEASKIAILEHADEHRSPASTLLRALFAFRSRFAEDRLAQAAARGAGQYVILGAGLDTFPWRQPQFAQPMRIFYADHPATLTWSRKQFRHHRGTAPSNTCFVPVDLEKLELGERLEEYGFDRRRGAFCSMLGVTQYLSRKAIEALLRVAASWRGPSEIVLSFVLPDDELDEDDRAIAFRGASSLQAIGEPVMTRFRSSEIFALLTGMGFGEIFHLTPKRVQERYFTGRSDSLRPPRLEQLIAAIV